MQQNITLKDFYRAMQAWIDDGCPNDNPHGFIRDHGLCLCLVRYMQCAGHDTSTSKEYYTLDATLYYSFTVAGLNGVFPFNTGPGSVGYGIERNKYTNPRRLQWIKSHLE